MTIALKAAGTFVGNSFSGSIQTIGFSSCGGTLASYTTQAGDCIVVAYSISGSTVPTQFSGASGTWVVKDSGFTGPVFGIVIGYACIAGQNSFTINGHGNQGDLVIGVFSGVALTNPIGIPQVASSASATTLSTPSVSYTGAAQAVIGAGGEGGNPAWNASTWSDGNTNNNVAQSNSQRGVTLDYELPSTSGSTTYTANLAFAQTMRVMAVTLNPVGFPFVQMAGASNTSPCAITSNTKQGDQLVALVAFVPGAVSPNLTGVTDSQSNSWTVDIGGGGSAAVVVGIAHCTLATALTTSDTVTCSKGAGATIAAIMLIELTDLGQAAPDKTSTNGPFNSSSDSTGSTGALSQALEIIVSWGATANTGTITWTKPSGTTEVPTGLGTNPLDAAYVVVNSTASVVHTWTQGTTTQMIAGIAAFKLFVPPPPSIWIERPSFVPQIASSTW